MLQPVPGKPSDPGPDEKLRVFLRGYVDERFGGNQKAAAAAFGFAASLLSEFLAGSRGAGKTFLYKVAAHTGRSVDSLMGLAEHDEAPEAGNAVGWVEAERAYRKTRPDIPEWVYPKARRARNAVLAVPVSLDDVEALVQMAWRNTPTDEMVRLERERIEQSNEALRKRAATIASKKALEAGAENDAPFLTSPTPRAKKGAKKPGGKE